MWRKINGVVSGTNKESWPIRQISTVQHTFPRNTVPRNYPKKEGGKL
ncbi:MAG: hypothetical protein GF350_06645 [Chitinivibrionales bacterium]|nr:hypothetical protein [Chitinivibrionales bacterium]